MQTTSQERWQRIQNLLDKALELSPDLVEEFLTIACASDSELQRDVQALLQAINQSEGFLDAVPTELAAALLGNVQAPPPPQIGPYTLLQEIGTGGMGVVYLAERADVQKRVALKLLSGGLHSRARIERFLFERRVLARLEHPNIARLLDAGVTTTGVPWLVMEYVDGERIDEWCNKRQLGARERLTLFAKVCDAVAFAHRNLIVHRDLKPSNIMVTADGEPRLLDFGIAKLLAGSNVTGEPITVTDARPMTPDYASPEQIRGDVITTASDVYQLGMLLHELLTGRRMGAPGNVTHGTKASGRDIDTIVRMATHPDAARRYESALQLRSDVQRYLEGRPVLARAPTLRYRAGKFIGRHKAASALASGVVLLVLGSVSVAMVQARRVARERDRAEQVSAVLTDLFASADPTVSLGDSVTVRAVLERGALRVRAQAALDPMVRARLLDVIAVAYRNLGMLPRAIELQTEAVSTLQQVVSADDPALLDARRSLGEWQAEAGQARAALPVLEEVLALERKQGPKRRRELSAALHATAWAHQLTNEVERARVLYEEALAIQRTLPPDSVPVAEATLSNLAALAANREDFETSEALYREALERRRARYGEEHPVTARSMNALAGTLLKRGRAEEADQLAASALAILRRTMPTPHRDVQSAIALQAARLSSRGELAQAEVLQREALEMSRALYGDNHVTVARALADLGGLVSRQGRYDEAAEIQRLAADRYIALEGNRTLASAIALTNLAYTEFLRRRLAQSESLYRRALPVLDSLRRGTGSIATELADFATVLAQQNKCAEAEPEARRSYELARARWPENNVDVIRPQRILGQCLVVLQRYADAEPLLLDAHKKLLAGWGEANPYTRAAAQDLVRMYERWGVNRSERGPR